MSVKDRIRSQHQIVKPYTWGQQGLIQDFLLGGGGDWDIYCMFGLLAVFVLWYFDIVPSTKNYTKADIKFAQL